VLYAARRCQENTMKKDASRRLSKFTILSAMNSDTKVTPAGVL
jgi:hypothetical protein